MARFSNESLQQIIKDNIGHSNVVYIAAKLYGKTKNPSEQIEWEDELCKELLAIQHEKNAYEENVGI